MHFRTTDNTKWGAGKGSNLTPGEVDENFWDLGQRTAVLEANPPAPVGIDHVTTAGNTFTIVLTDGSSQGPFNLPAAKFNLVGEWAPNVPYVPNSFVTEAGKTYLILHPHTSGAFFDPGANDGAGHNYYGLLPFPDQPIIEYLDDGWQAATAMEAFKLFSVPDRGVYLSLRAHVTATTFDPAAEDGGGNALYRKIFAAIETDKNRIQFQYPGTPPSDGSIILVYIQDDERDLVFATDWPGSSAHLNEACTDTIEWTIEHAGDVVGTITFESGSLLDGEGGQFGTFAGDGVTVANQELLKLRGPNAADASAKFLTVSLIGAYQDLS